MALAPLLCLLLLSTLPESARAQEIVTLASRPGIAQTYFLAGLPKSRRAIAVMFPGGGGFIRIRRDGEKIKFENGNFLIRSRGEFIKRGIIAALIDAPSDQQRNWGMTDEFRMSEQHAADVSAVLADLRKRFAEVPIFLVGTSRGTVSAAALGARLGDRLGGIVLTSTMFRSTGPQSSEPGPALSGFDFGAIKVPLLFVHHVSDQCVVTPYGDAARLADHYSLVTIFGGRSPQSDPCAESSAHGFFGRESETVEQIVNWMMKKPFLEQVK